ncbi:SAM-dependent methyltransferase [Desulfonema limicola]|uniref:SAM-dependent methyltransferase n=1 Tax=Desulfonema limicola TaxID=45656 RepID=A0A975B5R2_9BACT|nr:DNA methyltransferase [Desulfonema limicola]QTA79279.1 SAM-dependent methyltransferase [Desulfonema limicola]
MSKQNELFKTNTVPGKSGSGNLFDEEFDNNDKPVICLGKKFDNDDARRVYFTEILREKLKDPDFRRIEGFPIGKDEDILALSDPPYYTACPNPWIGEFIAEWEAQKPPKEEGYQYHREPFAADVSEGKNDPIYNAHSYHTKVPHKAIMRYILHYTEPGDIVFDGFCGTGMTGVAAQMCGDKETVESLGVTKQSPEQKYKVEKDGTILERQIDDEGKYIWVKFSKLGARRAVLNDLSPAATFIAYNYNSPVDVNAFEKEAKRILAEVEEECGWMYETLHTDGKSKGKINYTVWSDVFICPECAGEVVFWEAAFDNEAGKVQVNFPCPHCSAELTKRKMERAWTTKYDSALKKSLKQAKQIPVLINYNLFNNKGRFEKVPDETDSEIIKKNESCEILNWYPKIRMIKGQESRRNDPAGITHIHHFYIKRNLYVLSKFLDLFNKEFKPQFQFLLGSVLPKLTNMNRYMPQHGSRALVGPMANTLYIPPMSVENNVIDQLIFQFKKIEKALTSLSGSIIASQAFQSLSINDNSLDYIFLDPPFGSNIMYSELNYIREAWFNVFTNNIPEAIENKAQKKGIGEYRHLITQCFIQAYKYLKPGHWMTVEFSNTKAGVWNSILNALSDAGFIVASVAALDKKRGGLHSMIGSTAVKQDLVISAYKPNGGFEERFKPKAQTEEGVWEFVQTHMKYLPISRKQGLDIVPIPERDPRILYDQVISYYVRKGYNIPIDSKEFQLGLSQRFDERDGMYFLPEQAAEYDRKKMIGGGRLIQQSMFVSDEASAIEWLRNLLRNKPQTYQDINPLFMKELSGWSKNEVSLELSTLLEQNFLSCDGKGNVPEQIHSYLSNNWKDMRNLPKDDPELMAKAKDRWYVPDPNKAGDLEKLREKALLKEFEEYKKSQKKLKIFRLEAVRTGFKKAWQNKDYAVIISVAEKIPNKILEEDPKLLLWYNNALTRTENSGEGF